MAAKVTRKKGARAMNKTTLEEFREQLLATGGYLTADERRAAKRAKPSALTTLRFSIGVSRVFPLCAVNEALGRLDTDKWAKYCFSTVQTAEALGMGVHVEGWQERQKYSGPVVYLCNHMSTVETILLPPILLSYGPFNVIVKSSLAHLPFLEKAAAHMGLVPVGRSSPREDLVNTLRIGEERIAKGESFLIFPQGSRESVFSRRMYSSIGAKLAARAGVPVCPIAVDTRCQPTRTKGLLKYLFKDFGPVDTAFDIRCKAAPLITCTDAKKMHAQSFEAIAGILSNWGLPVEE